MKAEIANELRSKYGAFVAVKDVVAYLQCSRSFAYKALEGVERTHGSMMFYKDVAAALARGN